MTEKDKQSDPRVAEAQIYNRLEVARGRITDAVNQVVKEVGLPTALVVELLRGVVTETTLTLERVAHQQTRAELAKVRKAGEKETKNGEAKNGEANP